MLFKGRRITYGELDALSDAHARGLRRDGVRPGDRVALLIPNAPQAIVSLFGAWKAGAIAVPLNPLYTEQELEQAIIAVGATAIVTLTPFYSKVKAVQPRTALRTVDGLTTIPDQAELTGSKSEAAAASGGSIVALA